MILYWDNSGLNDMANEELLSKEYKMKGMMEIIKLAFCRVDLTIN